MSMMGRSTASPVARRGLLAVLCVVALGLLGCEAAESLIPKDDAAAESAVASLGLTSTESALLAISVSGADSTQTLEQIATAAIDRIEAGFTPSGCASVTGVVPGTLALDMKDCSGPYGLVGVTGQAAIVYKIESGDVLATLTATGLKANNATLTINASGVLTQKTDESTLALTTNGVGTGPNGRLLARNGSYTFSWVPSTSCYKIVGTWLTTITTEPSDGSDPEGWTTTVADYGRCPNKCPDDKGTITYAGTGAGGVAITVSFDGTDKALYATTKGAGGTLPLQCQ
jgi:hypothetical protein